MNYIVLDLEWNQCPYGRENSVKEMPFEIIEIGAVRLDENLEKTGEFNRIIRPQVYKELHYMTRQIVHISSKELENGDNFADTMREFLDWCGNEYIYCTWGNMDLLELQRNMKFFGMGGIYTRPIKYLDIQKLFSIAYEDGKQRRTLQYVADYLKLDEEMTFHSALNDARYTARVIKHMDFRSVESRYSIDCYNIPANKKEEINVVFDTYSKYVSCGYESKDDMMKDKDILSLVCHKCNKKCHKKIRWFSGNTKTYYALGICNEHGYIKGKLRVKQAENGLFYVIKTCKHVDEEGAERIKGKQLLLREKRRQKRRRNSLKSE